jgi:hypothetical protein
MKEIGAQEFVAVIHDFINDRKSVLDQINRQIDRLDEYKKLNNNLDAVNLEWKFLSSSRKIDKIIGELNNFRTALFDQTDCGLTAKELYLTSDPERKYISLKNQLNFFKREQIEDFPAKIRRYCLFPQHIHGDDYPWVNRKSFKSFIPNDKKELVKIISEIPAEINQFNTKLRSLISLNLKLDQLEQILTHREHIDIFLKGLENPESFQRFQQSLKLSINYQKLFELERELASTTQGVAVENSIPGSQLQSVKVFVAEASEARKSPFRWILWKLFSKNKRVIYELFQHNRLTLDIEGFTLLNERIEKRIKYEKIVKKVKAIKGVGDFTQTYNSNLIDQWFLAYHDALNSKEVLERISFVNEYLEIHSIPYEELKNTLSKILQVLEPLPLLKKRWMQYLTVDQIEKLAAEPNYPIDLSEKISQDFNTLVEFDKYIATLQEYEIQVLKLIYEAASVKNGESLTSLFDNSIRLEWLYFLEAKYTCLTLASSGAIDLLEDDLLKDLSIKQTVCKEILLMRLREQCYKEITYNRLNNMVTYRELNHQATKKKKIWPLRKIFGAFHQELFNLVPCWMASPDSVSAMFPLDTVFDLVIFDEASQCYAERAIPAIYRASQVIITGDDKQLGPSDLYQARWEEEDDDNTDLELDSILSLGEKYLKSVLLTGHYRSRHPELIEFSNYTFYKSKLQTIPEYNSFIKNDPPIKYIKIDGIWNEGINTEEAQEVVALTIRLIKDGKQSIGIVCFNYKQAWHINDMLEKEIADVSMTVPPTLFIKNIENVQGDERDIIIFSVGYAPDLKGKFVMNFGSLNASYGENRLNVAITRARDRIYLISSIIPAQLHVDSSLNVGPKLFKAFLEYAWEVSEGRFIYKIVETRKSNHISLADKLCSQIPTLGLTKYLPFGDLTVTHNRQTTGMILTDDDQYHSAASPKEPHAFQIHNLEKKHWRFQRVYSRNFWIDRKKLGSDLYGFFKNLPDA